MTGKFNPFAFVCAGLMVIGGSSWWWYAGRGKNLTALTAQSDVVADEAGLRWKMLFDSSWPLEERQRLALEADESLSLQKVDEWARSINPHTGGRRQDGEIIVFNGIVDQFRRKDAHSATLGLQLIKWVEDSKLHPTLRDYAVQHFGLWLGDEMPPSSRGGQNRKKLREAGPEVLCRVIEDPAVRTFSLPGTALLVLGDLAARSPDLMASRWNRLDGALDQLIIDNTAPVLLRVSAMQTAARARRDAVLPKIRQLLTGSDLTADEGLAFAAVGALGSLGDRSDRPLLLHWAASGAITASAARAALKRIPE